MNSPPDHRERSAIRDLLTWEQRFSGKRNLKLVYIDLTGDHNAGLLLSQITYWWSPSSKGLGKLRINRDGRWWIAKRRTDWWDEIRLSPKQYDRAARILREKKMITTNIFRFRGDPITHVTLNAAAVLRSAARFRNRTISKGDLPVRKIKYSEAQASFTDEKGKPIVQGKEKAKANTPAQRLGEIYMTALKNEKRIEAVLIKTDYVLLAKLANEYGEEKTAAFIPLHLKNAFASKTGFTVPIMYKNRQLYQIELQNGPANSSSGRNANYHGVRSEEEILGSYRK